MDFIKSLQDFDEFLAVCRKHNLAKVVTPTMEISFNDQPAMASQEPEVVEELEGDELIYYSSQESPLDGTAEE